jgi:O-acetylhomoserine (thiol)-lyase
MVFSEESTVGAFLLRARREGLRDFGACLSPHSAWLILQGIETLPLRMDRHMANTERVVQFLASHPLVAAWATPAGNAPQPRPGAPSCCRRQGAGSVFSFDIKGSRAAGQGLHRSAEDLQPPGQRGRLPLAGHPPGQHHALPHDDEALAGAGIGPGTIRLSIGLEDPDDLIDDLKRALKAAEKAALPGPPRLECAGH